MRRGAAITLIMVVLGVALGGMLGAPRRAAAQPDPAARAQPDAGYIGREITSLEIDDCRQTELTRQQIKQQGSEHFERGFTLYLQGDYEGAVREFIYSYCLVPTLYLILKDIGQAYERSLDYEKAIGYFERYVKEIPPDAKPAKEGDVDPQQDKANIASRVEVLKKLKAKIYVESSPPGARVTIANDAGVAVRAHAGETIEVLGGHYDMTTELDGWEPHHQAIDVRIGKPYAYFVPLVAEKGRLSMQVFPPDARIFIDDRLVGIGRVDVELPGNTYTVTSEAPERITDKRKVEVLANKVNTVQVALAGQRQLGRRQLIGFSAAAGAGATASLLYAFQNTGVAGLGSAAGGAAGFLGSFFLLPDDLPLGTSNLAITATLGGSILGASTSLLFTGKNEVIAPVVGASAVLGGTFGYYMGNRAKISTGDAALINSGIVWGSAAGGLFALSFGPGRVGGAGLVLSGLGMGTVGGLLLSRTYSITRTHAALLDIGGLVGIIVGLAAESRIYPAEDTQGTTNIVDDPQAREHLANFALGGMAVGLLTAGILTRNIDTPAIPVAPSITPAVASDGRPTTMYGVTGTW